MEFSLELLSFGSQDLRGHPAVKLVEGSSTDSGAVQEACLEAEAVHLGGKPCETQRGTSYLIFFELAGKQPLNMEKR